jgi:hypothetical protein
MPDDSFTTLRRIQRAVTDYKNAHRTWVTEKVDELGFIWDRTIYTSTLDPELQKLLDDIHAWISSAAKGEHNA